MTHQTPVSDPALWKGADLETDRRWLFELGNSDVKALVHMARAIRPRLNQDANALLALGAEDFDLGAFKRTVSQVYDMLKSGLGIALIRGLPMDQLDPLEAAIIYWGIGKHLGEATVNNPEGDMLGHITDLGKTQKDANSRGYQTRELMDYHCDQSDIVGLLCLRPAKSGGVSMVASSVAMFNTLLERHPDYAAALAEPFFWTKHGEFADGDLPYYQSPVFNFFDGQLCTSF